MDEQEAGILLAHECETWRKRPYEELVALMGRDRCEHADVVGPSGTMYQIEVNVLWDAGRDVRVIISIDDGGWRAFVPLTDSFIMAPDGSFVGE